MAVEIVTCCGTGLKTVGDVMGGLVQSPPRVAGETPPTPSIACNGGSCSTGRYGASVRFAVGGGRSVRGDPVHDGRLGSVEPRPVGSEPSARESRGSSSTWSGSCPGQ